MGKRGPSQPDKKHIFESPTTKGLYVTLQAYLIELICLNMNPKLGPRFWRMDYWSKKFSREVRGVKLLLNEFGGVTSPVFQKAIFAAIKKIGCRSFLRQSTRIKIDRITRRMYAKLMQERDTMATKASVANPSSDYAEKNARFVESIDETKLGKLRKIENG